MSLNKSWEQLQNDFRFLANEAKKKYSDFKAVCIIIRLLL